MTLANQVQESLSSWRPEGAGRHSWSHAADGWAVHLAADHNDAIAALVWEMTLIRTGDAPNRTVKQWAEKIAASASGLMEDLKVIEVDAERNEAILRSDEPSRKGPLAAYYEVMLHGINKAFVRRFQADTKAGTRRNQVAFAITHEVLAKLAEDIAE